MIVPTCKEFDQSRHVLHPNMLRVLKRVTLCGPVSDVIAADSAGFMVNEVRVPSSSFDSVVFVRVRISKGLNQLASLNDVRLSKKAPIKFLKTSKRMYQQCSRTMAGGNSMLQTAGITLLDRQHGETVPRNIRSIRFLR